MNLKSMKIDALVDLRSRIDAVLASKVSDERRALESELAKLTRYDFGQRTCEGRRPRRAGKSRAEVPQSRKSGRNLGRSRPETPVARRRDQVGKEARGFRDFRQRQGQCKEGPQEARRQEVTVY